MRERPMHPLPFPVGIRDVSLSFYLLYTARPALEASRQERVVQVSVVFGQ